MNRISVVTPWIDHPELIAAYEASMQGAEVIVIDNGSSQETAAALDRMANELGNGSKVIHNSENRYFTTANNQGWALTTGDVVAFVNNDIEGPGWLVPVMSEVKDGGIYGPGMEKHTVDGIELPYIEGWCIAASRNTWERISLANGPWDQENYLRCYGDDLDISFRARCAGMSLYQTHWPIRHLSNYTNRTLPGAYDFADRNRETFANQVREWKARQS